MHKLFLNSLANNCPLFEFLLLRLFDFVKLGSLFDNMPARVFSEEQEAHFISLWHDILDESQGQMLTQADKLRKAAVAMSKFSNQIGLGYVTVQNCKNKLDSLKKKVTAAYAKMKVMTQSDVQVADAGDLEVRKGTA